MRPGLLFLFCLIAASGFAQPITLNLQQVNRPDALVELAKVSGKDITFSSRFFDRKERLDFQYEQADFEVVLSGILKESGITFSREGKRYVLFRENPKSFTLSGYVLDGESGEALPAATVYIADLQAGTYTNEYGFFSLKIPPGTHQLLFRYIGYRESALALGLKADTRVEVSMLPDLTLEDVVISPENHSRPVPGVEPGNPVNIHGEFMKVSPGLGGEEDLIRAAHMMPGVQAGVDGTAGLNVRGGDPGQNLMLLDGVPVFIPFHLLGVYSVFNSSTVKSAKLVKGGFSARYGGRSSSILDVRTREGDLKQWHAGASVNLMNGRAYVEGPFQKDKGAILVSGRWTPSARLLNSFFSNTYFPNRGGKLETKFYDLNAKAHYTLGENDRIYASFFTGKDEFGREDEDETGEETEEEIYWGNTTAALRWNHLFSGKAFANTTLTYSRFGFQYTTFHRFTPADTSLPVTLYFVDNRSRNDNIGINTDIDWTPSDKHSLRFGAGVFTPIIRPTLTYLDHESDEVIQLDTVERAKLEELVQETQSGILEGNFYIEDEIHLGSKLKLVPGMRASFFQNGSQLYAYPEPRISLHYRPVPQLTVFASGNRMVQYLHLVSNTALRFPNDLWTPSSAAIKPQDTWMGEIGIGWQPTENLDFSVNAYYKYLDHLYQLPDSLNFLSSFDLSAPENYLEEGEGKAFGVETMGVYTDSRWSAMVSYTLAKAERQFEGINLGVPFAHPFDHRHQVKVFVTHKLGERFQIGVNWVYLSGNPRLDLAVVESAVGFTNLNFYAPGEKNQTRGPDYHRLDANLSYEFATGPFSHRLKVGAFNVYNRENVAYYVGTGAGMVNPVSAIPFRPSLFYGVEF